MTSGYSGKPKPDIVPQPKIVGGNQACRKITYRDRRVFECGKPTNGATYCKGCQMDLITLTDRAPAHQVRPPTNHSWPEDVTSRARSKVKRSA